ncbi:MAG: cytochrome P450 [Rhodospirillales bacterium]|nr:cytochrome P450 [Rhodospirillales bacterium]
MRVPGARQTVFRPLDPAFLEDPYPTYARLRDEHPVGWAATPAEGYAGFWFVSRYADVAAGLKDNRFGREITKVLPPEAFPPIPEQQKPLYAMLAAWMLFKDPPDHARLRRIAAPVFALRPPLQRIARRATRPVTLAGVELPANALLMLFPGSANRDAARWADPDTLDLTRDARGHLGFGTGVHTCPGAPLARLEARIAFEVLLARSEGLRFDPAQRPIPIAGYAAGNLGWNILPLLRTKAGPSLMPPTPDPTPDLFDPVCAIVAESLGIDRAEIAADTCAKNTPEWDSLAHLMILDALEKRFAVKLPRRAAYTAKDVGELAALVATTRDAG